MVDRTQELSNTIDHIIMLADTGKQLKIMGRDIIDYDTYDDGMLHIIHRDIIDGEERVREDYIAAGTWRTLSVIHKAPQSKE